MDVYTSNARCSGPERSLGARLSVRDAGTRNSSTTSIEVEGGRVRAASSPILRFDNNMCIGTFRLWYRNAYKCVGARESARYNARRSKEFMVKGNSRFDHREEESPQKCERIISSSRLGSCYLFILFLCLLLCL